MPEYIKPLTTEAHHIYLHRHEIQQPPSPLVTMVSWVMNGLADLEPLHERKPHANFMIRKIPDHDRTLAHYQPIRVTSATNTLRCQAKFKILKNQYLEKIDAQRR